MKSILRLFMVGPLLLMVNTSFAQIEIELDEVDSVDAYFILNQIDEIIADESKLDEITLSFDELMGIFPDSLTETLSDEELAEGRIEYLEIQSMAVEAFSELRKYAKSKMGEIYISENEEEGGVISYEVEYSLWNNEDETEGAEVDLLYCKSNDKIYFIFAEYY